MQRLIFICVLFISLAASAQSKDDQTIRALLGKQTEAWNRGDIDAFMKGYWESDSLMFIGKSGITYGYKNTLLNYKKNYSDTVAMGKLKFTLLHVNRVSSEAYFVVGKWHLTRTIGNIGGHYTLWFRKIKGQWVIVADHSS